MKAAARGPCHAGTGSRKRKCPDSGKRRGHARLGARWSFAHERTEVATVGSREAGDATMRGVPVVIQGDDEADGSVRFKGSSRNVEKFVG